MQEHTNILNLLLKWKFSFIRSEGRPESGISDNSSALRPYFAQDFNTFCTFIFFFSALLKACWNALFLRLLYMAPFSNLYLVNNSNQLLNFFAHMFLFAKIHNSMLIRKIWIWGLNDKFSVCPASVKWLFFFSFYTLLIDWLYIQNY